MPQHGPWPSRWRREARTGRTTGPWSPPDVRFGAVNAGVDPVALCRSKQRMQGGAGQRWTRGSGDRNLKRRARGGATPAVQGMRGGRRRKGSKAAATRDLRRRGEADDTSARARHGTAGLGGEVKETRWRKRRRRATRLRGPASLVDDGDALGGRRKNSSEACWSRGRTEEGIQRRLLHNWAAREAGRRRLGTEDPVEERRCGIRRPWAPAK